MARGDGIHRTNARNMRLTAAKITNAQQHNEREKESYVNQDIVPERTNLNVHFKTPTDDYAKMFEQMEADKIISTRGTKADAFLYGELVFDVNSAYFHNHGGYEFAKQFYADAYKAAVQIVGGERFVLSAVMHADERNRAMSEALGQDVYHYHLHVVYVPVVEKQILWTKRCKDPALVGTVKETIMQVSMSKKWNSKPALDENSAPILTAKGKPVLRKSYSVLQDDFYNFMKASGYTDLERGERGSSEEHLTVTQFKVEKEQERLDALDAKIEKREAALAKAEKKLDAAKGSVMAIQDIDQIGSRTFTGNITMSPQEADRLKTLAKEGISSRITIADLKDKLKTVARSEEIWRSRYEKLKEQTKDFLAAMERAPRKVMEFIRQMLHAEPERSEPAPVQNKDRKTETR